MKAASFLRGMGVGAAAGAAFGAIAAMKRDSVRTGVGRAMRQAGAALDDALYELRHMT